VEYRQLGNSGLMVSSLTLGTMTFGGGGPFANVGSTDVAGGRRQVDMCRDAGVNVIDTADVYSDGRSEEIVGEILEGRREDFLVATKVRMGMSGHGPNMEGLSRHHIIEGCEASLRRLRTDHIDLYQVHEWDGLTPLEETLEALGQLVDSGKVRYVGVSNYCGWQLMKTLGVAKENHLPRFVSQQIYYSLQERSAEYELLPLAVDQGLGTLVWSPLAGGLLSGKYRRGVQPSAGRQLTDWNEPPVYDQDKLYDTVEALVEIAEAHDVSAAQIALAWLLTRPTVASVIVGARTDEQLADNLNSADLRLADDEIARLEQISRPPLIYPYWHQLASSAKRFSAADLALQAPYLQS
jgi:aryl-alcohol dehydrogenase-like predicted oxidoreductase